MAILQGIFPGLFVLYHQLWVPAVKLGVMLVRESNLVPI